VEWNGSERVGRGIEREVIFLLVSYFLLGGRRRAMSPYEVAFYW